MKAVNEIPFGRRFSGLRRKCPLTPALSPNLRERGRVRGKSQRI